MESCPTFWFRTGALSQALDACQMDLPCCQTRPQMSIKHTIDYSQQHRENVTIKKRSAKQRIIRNETTGYDNFYLVFEVTMRPIYLESMVFNKELRKRKMLAHKSVPGKSQSVLGILSFTLRLTLDRKMSGFQFWIIFVVSMFHILNTSFAIAM